MFEPPPTPGAAAARQRRRRSSIAAFLCLALGLAAAPAVGQPAPARIPLRVAYVPVATWLPVWVAKEKGMFEQRGLDVTLTKFANVVSLPPTLGKQFDLAPATAPDLINAVSSGLNVIGVAGGTVETAANQSYQLMVRADSGINTAKDLEGKRVASAGIASVMHIGFLHWARRNGADPSAVIAVEVPFTGMLDQLKAGRIDAAEALQPFVNQMKQAGFKSIGAPLLSVDDPVIFPLWIADAGWARANLPALRQWSESLAEALAWIKGNDAEARAILAQYTGLPPAVAAAVPFPAYRFELAPAQIEVWHKVMVAQGRSLPKFEGGRFALEVRP